jgi:hypothetical protein
VYWLGEIKCIVSSEKITQQIGKIGKKSAISAILFISRAIQAKSDKIKAQGLIFSLFAISKLPKMHNHSEISRIEKNIADWEREVQRKVDIFNGVQPNNIPPKPQEPLLIPDFVPPADEVLRMLSLELEKLKSKCGYGHIHTPDFVKAVRRRDQLRKENSQTQEEI